MVPGPPADLEVHRSPPPRLLRKIEQREARVVVAGAGSVGLPLAVAVAEAGFPTVCYDRDRDRVDAVRAGRSFIPDVTSDRLTRVVSRRRLDATGDGDVLSSADVVIVCVPTPLHKTREPDTSFIVEVLDQLAPRMRGEQLMVLESTTFPGFTREVMLPRLAAGGRRLDQDFYLAFSPERIDPGNRTFGVENTPKVMGGVSATSLEVAMALYRTFVREVVPVSSADAAEMVKLLENTFRAVNIGLANETALMCARLGLDTAEIVAAAATKPFGFMPFYPGPGLGGQCVPVAPMYLSWKLRTLRYHARFIALADEINSAMPEVVVGRVVDALAERGRPVRGSRLLVCGVTYKRDVPDVRDSPAIDVIALLQLRGAEVAYLDRHVPSLYVNGAPVNRAALPSAGEFDCVIITTDHSDVDYAALMERARLVFDARDATRAVRSGVPGKVIGL